MTFEQWWEQNRMRFWEHFDPLKNPIQQVEEIAAEAWNAGLVALRTELGIPDPEPEPESQPGVSDQIVTEVTLAPVA